MGQRTQHDVHTGHTGSLCEQPHTLCHQTSLPSIHPDVFVLEKAA
ncbi:rCG50786 [Rattus norvegicus]|uniref:RCG50786 n=1 Tax=Rattus norvegicus TaxID=10116 RepID=A6KC42_RAT|nr:rCG50786 [Rattus norvegicus]